jgi:preprotein translocase subunit SecA
LISFQREAHEMYEDLVASVQHDVARAVYHVEVQEAPRPRPMHTTQPRRGARRAAQAQSPRTDSVGRNDPCPCGSGKKYKNCCMRKERITTDSSPQTHPEVVGSSSRRRPRRRRR